MYGSDDIFIQVKARRSGPPFGSTQSVGFLSGVKVSILMPRFLKLWKLCYTLKPMVTMVQILNLAALPEIYTVDLLRDSFSLQLTLGEVGRFAPICPAWQVRFERACQRLELGACQQIRMLPTSRMEWSPPGWYYCTFILRIGDSELKLDFLQLLGRGAFQRIHWVELSFLNHQRNQLGVSLSVAQGMNTLREARDWVWYSTTSLCWKEDGTRGQAKT